MAQKRFFEFQAPLISDDDNKRHIAQDIPGRYAGFDKLIYGGSGSSFTLGHQTGVIITKADQTLTNATGGVVTKQGVIVQEDAAIGPLTLADNSGNSADRIDYIIMEHAYSSVTIGGVAATYSVLTGPLGSYTPPTLPNPNIQTILFRIDLLVGQTGEDALIAIMAGATDQFAGPAKTPTNRNIEDVEHIFSKFLCSNESTGSGANYLNATQGGDPIQFVNMIFPEGHTNFLILPAWVNPTVPGDPVALRDIKRYVKAPDGTNAIHDFPDGAMVGFRFTTDNLDCGFGNTDTGFGNFNLVQDGISGSMLLPQPGGRLYANDTYYFRKSAGVWYLISAIEDTFRQFQTLNTTTFNTLNASKANKVIPAWQTLTTAGGSFAANYGAYGLSPVYITKDDMGRVQLRGAVNCGGGAASGALTLTLPAGYRPSYTPGFLVNGTVAANPAITVFIDPSGLLTLYTNGTLAGQNVFLDGITFLTL